jgi:hypothetical protein
MQNENCKLQIGRKIKRMGLLAAIVVVIHLLFIAFVAIGALLALKWPRVIYVHLPAVIWGMYVEFTHATCPLTPLENYFREQAGKERYTIDFIDYYLIPIVYPKGLTPDKQWILGFLIVIANVVTYTIIYRRSKTRNS